MKKLVSIACLIMFFSADQSFGQLSHDIVLDEFIESQSKVDEIISDPRVKNYPNIMDRFYSPDREDVKKDINIYDQFKNHESVNLGRKFLLDNFSLLDKVEDSLNVQKEVIVSLLFIESKFGSFTGRYQAVGVFASILKFSNDPDRKAWARRYLEDLILVSEQNDHIDLFVLNSSYAGAFGWPQFMPTSYMKFGFDGNRDGKVDLFDKVDAVWSTAKYLKENGWESDKRAAVYHYNRSIDFVDFIFWYSYYGLGSVDRVNLGKFNKIVSPVRAFRKSKRNKEQS